MITEYWSRVLCAIPQVPVGQSFHMPQCAYANPQPPVHPSPPPPIGNHKFVFKICRSVEISFLGWVQGCWCWCPFLVTYAGIPAVISLLPPRWTGWCSSHHPPFFSALSISLVLPLSGLSLLSPHISFPFFILRWSLGMPFSRKRIMTTKPSSQVCSALSKFPLSLALCPFCYNITVRGPLTETAHLGHAW